MGCAGRRTRGTTETRSGAAAEFSTPCKSSDPNAGPAGSPPFPRLPYKPPPHLGARASSATSRTHTHTSTPSAMLLRTMRLVGPGVPAP
jgi:hypothetical protein